MGADAVHQMCLAGVFFQAEVEARREMEDFSAQMVWIRGKHATMDVGQIKFFLAYARDNELVALRSYADGKAGCSLFFLRVAGRGLVGAWERELELAEFKAALAAPDFLLVTSYERHLTSGVVRYVDIWKLTDQGPTEVLRMVGSSPAVEALLAGVPASRLLARDSLDLRLEMERLGPWDRSWVPAEVLR